MSLADFVFQLGDYLEDSLGICSEDYVHIAENIHEDVVDVSFELHIFDNKLARLIIPIRFNANGQNVEEDEVHPLNVAMWALAGSLQNACDLWLTEEVLLVPDKGTRNVFFNGLEGFG